MFDVVVFEGPEMLGRGFKPAQSIKSFSSNENVIQGLSVLGPFKLD